jgi:hypothetical protein
MILGVHGFLVLPQTKIATRVVRTVLHVQYGSAFL